MLPGSEGPKWNGSKRIRIRNTVLYDQIHRYLFMHEVPRLYSLIYSEIIFIIYSEVKFSALYKEIFPLNSIRKSNIKYLKSYIYINDIIKCIPLENLSPTDYTSVYLTYMYSLGTWSIDIFKALFFPEYLYICAGILFEILLRTFVMIQCEAIRSEQLKNGHFLWAYSLWTTSLNKFWRNKNFC